MFLLLQIITFEPETPAGHPKFIAWFLKKTSAKYYRRTVCPQGQVKLAKVA